jgi:hypothetical protein
LDAIVAASFPVLLPLMQQLLAAPAGTKEARVPRAACRVQRAHRGRAGVLLFALAGHTPAFCLGRAPPCITHGRSAV